MYNFLFLFKISIYRLGNRPSRDIHILILETLQCYFTWQKTGLYFCDLFKDVDLGEATWNTRVVQGNYPVPAKCSHRYASKREAEGNSTHSEQENTTPSTASCHAAGYKGDILFPNKECKKCCSRSGKRQGNRLSPRASKGSTALLTP